MSAANDNQAIESGFHVGDCRDVMRTLPDACVQTCVTSPPYWGLRDYGHSGQLGLESTPAEYVAAMVSVFSEVKRVLRADGTLWLNLGDSYASTTKGSGGPSAKQDSNGGSRYAPRRLVLPELLKPKDLVGIPWAVAFALRDAGWYLRSEIIWHKLNPMPESITDRPTKAHEQVFLLARSSRYFYNCDAIREPMSHPDLARMTSPIASGDYSERSGRNDGGHIAGRGFESDPDAGRNKRSVWSLASQPFTGAHFATMPPDLVEPCILAGSKPGDLVLAPFFGSGTTGMVAEKHGRRWFGIDVNPEYSKIQAERTAQRSLVFKP